MQNMNGGRGRRGRGGGYGAGRGGEIPPMHTPPPGLMYKLGASQANTEKKPWNASTVNKPDEVPDRHYGNWLERTHVKNPAGEKEEKSNRNIVTGASAASKSVDDVDATIVSDDDEEVQLMVEPKKPARFYSSDAGKPPISADMGRKRFNVSTVPKTTNEQLQAEDGTHWMWNDNEQTDPSWKPKLLGKTAPTSQRRHVVANKPNSTDGISTKTRVAHQYDHPFKPGSLMVEAKKMKASIFAKETASADDDYAAMETKDYSSNDGRSTNSSSNKANADDDWIALMGTLKEGYRFNAFIGKYEPIPANNAPLPVPNRSSVQVMPIKQLRMVTPHDARFARDEYGRERTSTEKARAYEKYWEERNRKTIEEFDKIPIAFKKPQQYITYSVGEIIGSKSNDQTPGTRWLERNFPDGIDKESFAWYEKFHAHNDAMEEEAAENRKKADQSAEKEGEGIDKK